MKRRQLSPRPEYLLEFRKSQSTFTRFHFSGDDSLSVFRQQWRPQSWPRQRWSPCLNRPLKRPTRTSHFVRFLSSPCVSPLSVSLTTHLCLFNLSNFLKLHYFSSFWNQLSSMFDNIDENNFSPVFLLLMKININVTKVFITVPYDCINSEVTECKIVNKSGTVKWGYDCPKRRALCPYKCNSYITSLW